MQWPPELSDHEIVSPWRYLSAAQIARLRQVAHLGPCEAMECDARSVETGRLERVLAMRPEGE